MTDIKGQNASLFKMTDIKGSTSGVEDIRDLHKELDDVSCPICMDHPHNAVLIICSSHEKGCRSYICDTSYRHTNCLDRFKKLRGNNDVNNPSRSSSSLHNNLDTRTGRNLGETHEAYNLEENNGTSTGLIGALERNNNIHGVQRTVLEESNGGTASDSSCLKCPLCRGSVLGWMVVKEARQYLDLKQRSCAHEYCSFSGNYRELRRHARRAHPMTRPGDVDPSRQRVWHGIENQSEYGDVLSALRSEMPGALVIGDYVVDTRDDMDAPGGGNGQFWPGTLFLFRTINSPIRSLDEHRVSSRTWRTRRLPSRGHHHRNLLGGNLSGMRNDEDDGYIDDNRPTPRRRRRLMRSRSNEEHH